MKVIRSILLLLPVLFFSCRSYPPDIPKSVRNVLKKAEENKTELVKVIEHYQGLDDSLKLEAAYYLIGNMAYKYSDEYSYVIPFIETYQADRTTWADRRSQYHDLSQERLDSIKQVHGTQVTRTWDIQTITADYLIKNIELAFRAWGEPGARRFGFEEFCEYILPYRLHNEPLSDWREAFLEKYGWVKDSVDNPTDTEEIALYLNDLVGEGFRTEDFGLPFPPVMALDSVQIGECSDRYFLVTHLLRALGVPAMVDYTPQTDHTFKSHRWMVYLDTLGRYRPFDGGNPRSVPFHKQEAPRSAFPDSAVIPLANGFGSNAWRFTWAENPNSLAMTLKKNIGVPLLFRTPYLKNVTGEYLFEKYDTEIDVSRYGLRNRELVYLSVFGYGDELREADWARVEKGKVRFSNVGAKVVYLLSRYVDERLVPFSDPFVATAENPQFLTPDTIHRQELTLTRKCNISPQMREFANDMVGAMFQGSESGDFRSIDTLFTIAEAPSFLIEQSVGGKKVYRYVRYYSPQTPIHVAELHFIGTNERGEEERLTGQVITNRMHAATETPENFSDGNLRSNYNAEAGGWIGFDLGTPRQIERVEYLPRNNWNVMEPGHVYELFYYDRRWISLGQSTTENQYLKIENVPTGALFLLRNRTQGKEERIFTYENGQQVWW